MSKWIRRVVALLAMSTLLAFGGCLSGMWGQVFNWQRTLEAVVAANLFD